MSGLTYFMPSMPAAKDAPAVVTLTTAQLAGSALLQLQLAACLLLGLKLVRRLPLLELFGLRQQSLAKVVVWAFAGLVLTIIAMQVTSVAVLQWVLGMEMPKETDQVLVQAFKQSHDVMFRLVLAGSAAVVAPLTEELYYRGLIYGFTRRFTGTVPAMLLSAAIFSLAHVNVMAALPLFVFGVGLAFAYERSRSLAVPVLMHMLFNAWNLVAMLLAAP